MIQEFEFKKDYYTNIVVYFIIINNVFINYQNTSNHNF